MFVSKHRMSSIMTVCLNLFLSCQDVSKLDWSFPVFTCFSLKGSTRILVISSEKHVIPHSSHTHTWKEEGIIQSYKYNFTIDIKSNVFHDLYEFHRQRFSWVCLPAVLCFDGPIEFKNHIKQINNCFCKMIWCCVGSLHFIFNKNHVRSLRSGHKMDTNIKCLSYCSKNQTPELIPGWRKLEQEVCFLRICGDLRMWSKHKELMNSAVPEYKICPHLQNI